MFMSDYDVALCDKLYDFRENFEEDNIYSYWILLTLIKEIFLDEEHEVSINVKENLKNTINILLQFYELRQKSAAINWEDSAFDVDLEDKDSVLRIINRVFDLILIDENYNDIKEENNIQQFFTELIQKINDIVEDKEIDLPYSTESEWSEQIEKSLNNESFDPNLEIPKEDQYHIQKNPKFLKEYIFRTGLIQYKCAHCGLEEWQNEPIPLILDFIDGNKRNQNLYNLRFLCPNCYSQIGKDFE